MVIIIEIKRYIYIPKPSSGCIQEHDWTVLTYFNIYIYMLNCRFCTTFYYYLTCLCYFLMHLLDLPLIKVTRMYMWELFSREGLNSDMTLKPDTFPDESSLLSWRLCFTLHVHRWSSFPHNIFILFYFFLGWHELSSDTNVVHAHCPAAAASHLPVLSALRHGGSGREVTRSLTGVWGLSPRQSAHVSVFMPLHFVWMG